MKNFKSFIQLDEVERVKYKDGIANKMAYANDGVKDKGHGRLDNKQEFGEGDAYDKDVKASPKPHDKEAAAARAKLAALAARKAMMTNKMSEAESHQSKTTMKHIDNPNAAEKKAAKDIKSGIPGIRDRFAMLDAAKKRGALKEDDKAMDDDLKRKLAAKLRDRALRLGADHDRMPKGKPPTEHPGFPDSKIDFAGRIKKAAQEREKAMKDREALKKEDFESIDESDSFQSHLDKAAAAKKAGKTADYHSHMQKYHDSHAQMASRNPNWGGGAGSERKNQDKAIRHGDKADALRTTKKEDADLLSDLYNQLDESNQEIFLAQLEEDAEVLLAFAKTIAEE